MGTDGMFLFSNLSNQLNRRHVTQTIGQAYRFLGDQMRLLSTKKREGCPGFGVGAWLSVFWLHLAPIDSRCGRQRHQNTRLLIWGCNSIPITRSINPADAVGFMAFYPQLSS
jgi:hypothetical protein